MANINPTDGSPGYNISDSGYFKPLNYSLSAGGITMSESENVPVRSDSLKLSDEAVKLYYAGAIKTKQFFNTKIKPVEKVTHANKSTKSLSTGAKA